MSELTRFGVSLKKELLQKFDKHIKARGYPTRSKAVADLIRDSLVREQWLEGKEVAGAVTIVYNHHRRDLVNKLTAIQHEHHDLIISSQHIHLDKDNCLEIIIARGKSKEIEKLADRLKSTKGVKYGAMTMATTGEDV